MQMNFCRRCGEALTNIQNHIYKCVNNHTIFANSSPTVGVFFIDSSNNLVLSRRGCEPNKNMLDIIGGFLDGNESLEEALAREINEETGLTNEDYSNPVYLCSIASKYEFNDENNPIVSTIFYSYLKPDTQLDARDDVAEIVTVPLTDLDVNEIGNDDIKQGAMVLQKLLRS